MARIAEELLFRFSILLSGVSGMRLTPALHFLGTLLLWVSLPAVSSAVEQLTVDAGTEKWTISPYLVGTHHEYTNDSATIIRASGIIPWGQDAAIGTSRYPGGGTVKVWDWEHPNGAMQIDVWDPTGKARKGAGKTEPPSDFMSLDQFLDYSRGIGLTPFFGVNDYSGVRFNRVDDSVARAVRMVQYVKSKGFGGALWYIGNEETNLYPGKSMDEKIAAYARNFALHAKAMKAADPRIRIFWNDNKVGKSDATRMKLFLANDEGTADGVETHGKWPSGGDNGLPPRSLKDWMSEFPLTDHKNNRDWRATPKTLRDQARAAGRPDLLIADLEYGLGGHTDFPGFNRFTKDLVMTEVLQDHAIGNWFAAAFWTDVRDHDEDGLIAYKNGNRLNPLHFGMQLIAKVQGGKMLGVSFDHEATTPGFAAKKEGDLYVFLLNKRAEAQTVTVKVKNFICSGGTALVMQDTADHFGELINLTVTQSDASTVSVTLPPMTYTRVRLSGPTSSAPAAAP
jgi:hypothetical protein